MWYNGGMNVTLTLGEISAPDININLLELSPIIIITIIILVGAFLFIYGFRSNGQKRIWFGAALIAFGVVSMIMTDPEIGGVFSAISAILIAVFAGFQIVENRRLREESNAFKQIERREKQLDNIIQWAKNIIEYDSTETLENIDNMIEDDNPAMKSLSLSMSANKDFIRFRNNGNDVVLPIASIFGSESLIYSISLLTKQLDSYLNMLGKEQILMMKEI